MSIDIERLKVDPAYWDAVAPEGATHWHSNEFVRWTGKIRNGMPSLDVWDDYEWTADAYGFNGALFEFVGQGAIARPEVSAASLISDELAQEIGQKHDAHKPRHSLLPVGSVASIIDVLEFGAVKYGADNWQSVPDSRTRYYDAAMRHLAAWWGGERLDAESGLPHLAHAACCILFLMWGDK